MSRSTFFNPNFYKVHYVVVSHTVFHERTYYIRIWEKPFFILLFDFIHHIFFPRSILFCAFNKMFCTVVHVMDKITDGLQIVSTIYVVQENTPLDEKGINPPQLLS